MYIDRLQLLDFRNYNQLDITFSKGMNLVYGENAQGKTNILESIFLCSTGKSHRTSNDKELIGFGKDEAKILVDIKKNIADYEIAFHLHKREKKKVLVNGLTITKMGELLGHVHVVMFSPEDLGLIKKGPQDRRRFMDIELCQLYPRYFYDLTQYNKVLKQRNELLKEIKYNPSLQETLFAWDDQLVQLGSRIIEKRKIFIDKLKVITKKIHFSITSGKEEFKVSYELDVRIDDYYHRLQQAIEKDIQRGYTSVGPHRDDLSLMIGNLDLRVYGSQGQQRCGALSLKLAELEFVKQEIGEYPILLLDDVMSELDPQRQNDLLKHVNGVQTIVTGTSIDMFYLEQLKEVKLFKIEQGMVLYENLE